MVQNLDNEPNCDYGVCNVCTKIKKELKVSCGQQKLLPHESIKNTHNYKGLWRYFIITRHYW